MRPAHCIEQNYSWRSHTIAGGLRQRVWMRSTRLWRRILPPAGIWPASRLRGSIISATGTKTLQPSIGPAGWLADQVRCAKRSGGGTRRAEQLQDAHFRLYDQQNDLAAGIDAFGTVYARSWKQPEPYPAFNRAQIRAAGSLGLARLGVWWIGETPAAAQFWIVEHGRATVLKLAHDERFKEHSPGTVLTAWMSRHMLEQAHVAELDFGRGDDAYKRDWVGFRRQRMGVMLINPRHPRGMLALVRHRVGRITAGLRHS